MNENRMKLTFFDEYWIDFRPGTIRRWYKPELINVVYGTGVYGGLVYDSERKKYRLFHETLIKMCEDGPRLLKMVESDDMINWTTVTNDEGGDVLFDGDGGVHGSSVLYDPYDPDPNRRYKFCGMTRMAKPIQHPVNLAFSPDGIHWENRPDLVAHPHTSDAHNKLFYNPCSGEFNLLHRSAFVDRRVSLRSSKDLTNWTEPRVLLHPAGTYNKLFTGIQHYSMTVGWFDGLFYGFVWRYNTSLYDMDFSKMFGYMETELVYSYDGKEFLYTTMEPVVDRPNAPTPGWAGLSPTDMCESVDGKHYFLMCSGAMFVHGSEATNQYYHDQLTERGLKGGQVVFKIRKDGFCGLESVGKGMVVTKNLDLLKDDLYFNLRADCGFARFGIMDPSGEYLEGFGLNDCIPFEFNEDVAVRPQWKEHKLEEILNRQIRIAVELNGAVLHSISATARPHICQVQKSFSDPQGIFE